MARWGTVSNLYRKVELIRLESVTKALHTHLAISDRYYQHISLAPSSYTQMANEYLWLPIIIGHRHIIHPTGRGLMVSWLCRELREARSMGKLDTSLQPELGIPLGMKVNSYLKAITTYTEKISD